MSVSRERILSKLRAARSPFPAAAPRPKAYLPVTSQEDTSPGALLERFRHELERLDGEVFVTDDDDDARETVLDLLASANAERIACWHFKHIPVKRLHKAIRSAGFKIDYPNLRRDDPDARARELRRLESAEVGLTGADAVVATTGTLVVTTGPGKGRIPTVLPPLHIAVVTLSQFLPRLEDWLAQQRADDLAAIRQSSNLCLISGPSRTADIEKQLVLGVHGPKKVQVVVKRDVADNVRP